MRDQLNRRNQNHWCHSRCKTTGPSGHRNPTIGGIAQENRRSTVKATGDGTLNYQWKQDGEVIPSANCFKVTPLTTSGEYICEVSNNASTVPSQAAKIQFNDPIQAIVAGSISLPEFAVSGSGKVSLSPLPGVFR